jgi:hypothetical protein
MCRSQSQNPRPTRAVQASDPTRFIQIVRVTRTSAGLCFRCLEGLFTWEAFVGPDNAFSMERRAGREEAQRPVKRHDKRAHSRETVASVLVERMHAQTWKLLG